MLEEEAEFKDTVRISLYFYNSYEEIDKLILALKDFDNIKKYVNL